MRLLVTAALLSILQPADTAASVSYIVFPSTGCWAVVATKGPEQIQFITQVVEP